MGAGRRRGLDAKQVISTVVGGVFCVGLVFLVGMHLSRQRVEQARSGAEASLPPVEAVDPELSLERVTPADYAFFDLLDAPAPRRDAPPPEVGVNPALVARQRGQARRSDEEATRSAEAKVAAAESKRKEKSPRTEDAVAVVQEKPPERAQTRAASPAPEVDAGRQAGAARPAEVEAGEGARAAEGVVTRASVDLLLAASATMDGPGPRSGPAEGAARQAPKVEEKAPAAAKGASAGGQYTVQVSAFQEETAARLMAEDLRRQGFDARVRAEDVPGRGRWYRVRVGSHGTRDDAEKVRAKVKANGLDGFVTTW